MLKKTLWICIRITKNIIKFFYTIIYNPNVRRNVRIGGIRKTKNIGCQKWQPILLSR